MRLPVQASQAGIYDTAFPRRRGARGGWSGLRAYMPDITYNPTDTDLTETGDIFSVGTQVLNVINTAQIRQINIERAKQGLPPIDSSAIAPQVNVGLSPETQRLILFGGIALIAFLVLRRG